ncbi:ATP-binding protein [Telmatospirillum sp.]|uniref:ATP-binding protein n=1 Tax=Telmatospirillum sp. TaxID=2079197 RepID=UPI00283ED54C|nr:ATP-binding protein [Telmatospirillum sp.]MDR3438471.1 ATP-binding protein [Telmatospirillum sp.]
MKFTPAAWIKSILPRGLLGRSLLILVLPLIILQLVSAYVFFGTHWDMVTRRLAAGLAGDIGAVIEMMRTFPGDHNRAIIFSVAANTLDLKVSLDQGGILETTGVRGLPPRTIPDPTSHSLESNLIGALAERVGRPVYIDTESLDREVKIQVQLSDGVLNVRASRKRLYSTTTTIFVLWMVGTSLLLFGIATIFMRNQVRAVRRLAAAVDSFGKGRDVANFKPQGAAEVRQAAAAFARMQDRIRLQVSQRTEMLAGVSHDLRTPLTRMKLALAMAEGESIAELQEDVADMERMIEGYLAFARGEGSEKSEPCDLTALLEDVVAKLRRERGNEIDLICDEALSMPLRPLAISRCLTNLIGNAARYATHVVVRAGRAGDAIEVIVDDDGPGIPANRREDVFKAFLRLEGSRNPQTGGVGLGLTIARDVARAHGGDVTLDDAPTGGLRVCLRLPL